MTGELLASIEREVRGWSGAWKKWDENGLGGVEITRYRFGGSPIVHAHDNGVADFRFPRALYDELIRDGRAKPHPVGFANVVSYYLREPEEVPGAVKLFRMNYERLRAHEKAADDNDLLDPRTTMWGNGSSCSTLRGCESAEGKALWWDGLPARGGARGR